MHHQRRHIPFVLFTACHLLIAILAAASFAVTSAATASSHDPTTNDIHHDATNSNAHNPPPSSSSSNGGYRIAIIGGGISGTFSAKYLAEYDTSAAAAAAAAGGSSNKKTCLLDEIIVYDVSPPPSHHQQQHGDHNPKNPKPQSSSSDPRPPQWQGSRVSTLQLNDGTVIELGASIIYSGNKLVVDMMEGDPEHLAKVSPMSTGNDEQKTTRQAANDDDDDGKNDETNHGKEFDKKSDGTSTTNNPSGFGIYHGQKEWLLKPSYYHPLASAASTTIIPNILQQLLNKIAPPIYFLWRYNLDFIRLRQAVQRAVHAFDVIYELVQDVTHEVTFFESPMDMWEAIGLRSVAGISFHDFLDGLGLSRCGGLELDREKEKENHHHYGEKRWWMPGCLRSELVTAMTLNTYNQDLNQMNGLVGLVAYVPAGGDLFSIKGGNYKLMESALRQANTLYDSSTCHSSTTTPATPRIQRHQKQITTVVSGENSMELFTDEESLGNFDIVILAAPLQQSRINFLIKSHMDPLVLHPMPLGGMHDNQDSEDNLDASSKMANNEHGDLTFAAPLPSSATTPYTSVVTTVVSNATLNATHFGLHENEQWPRSILVSERGKLLEGISTLTILSIDKGLMKTFSSEELTLEKRNDLFGLNHVVEYVQMWGGGEEEGGKYGGATPNFDGGRNSESLSYLLYDGAKHWGNMGSDGDIGKGGPALYYANAIESAVAAIEISAIGAKSTAKLVAQRLELVRPGKKSSSREEL